MGESKYQIAATYGTLKSTIQEWTSIVHFFIKKCIYASSFIAFFVILNSESHAIMPLTVAEINKR